MCTCMPRRRYNITNESLNCEDFTEKTHKYGVITSDINHCPVLVLKSSAYFGSDTQINSMY